MTIRYANEILLTELARRITNEIAELNALLTDGALADAKAKTKTLRKNLGGLRVRLNDIITERL